MRFSRRANPKNQDDKKTTSNTCFGDLILFWKASLRESTFLNGEVKKIEQYLQIDLSEGGLNLFLTGGVF
ncbi:conserved protein of unknown function [Streptococcus thermophilus]|uniref:Uncharacterized protein n=1 Tax=Streptococcus thermophilus TaxID=1308 RepID=A0A7U7CAZ2_STRTR|nr:conserved protein of unknown function [Streptococcus thermophilus]CAD0143837.1 conserved protein of unknown function [Streptococcus thermophilus]CAD0148277.1 conserved protein of unknown function [Streptococcus thermophilus]CAD0149419.1 conserved protein of unknown function [Streptococcus thermophilus]CAD0151443.1 conserved protein of unknown function [Streptococcus thermophilus]